MGLPSDYRVWTVLFPLRNLFPILKQFDGHNDQQGPSKLYSFFLKWLLCNRSLGMVHPLYMCSFSFCFVPFCWIAHIFPVNMICAFLNAKQCTRTYIWVPLWCSSCINQSYLDLESIYDQDLDQSYLDLESIYNLDLNQSYLLAPWVLCTQPMPQKVPADPFWGTGEA